jgi:cyanophycinase-like exopeptidase
MIRIVAQNSGLFAHEDALHDTLLLANGVVRPVMTTAGEIIMMPSSTAYDAMGEDEFKAYFDAALETIQTHIIPGIDLDALLKEARQQSNYKDAANDNDERPKEEVA